MRNPLGPRTCFTEVQARIAVRLVQLDIRRNPAAYEKHKPQAILALADRLRSDHVTVCYPYLVSLAKAIQLGGTMDSWRSWAMDQSGPALRAIHKRPFRPRT